MRLRPLVFSLVVASALVSGVTAQNGGPAGGAAQGSPDGFRFKSGVELINVTTTVTDQQGRFVPGLRQEDFVVYDDGEPQTVTHFSNERVPVSLGMALDTSGSMAGEKMTAARGAIDSFMNELLGQSDEMFLYHFANLTELVQPWTNDRRLLGRAVADLYPGGGTRMYDAIADAIPIAQSGKNSKKALVVISDGNDTGSRTTAFELRNIIRESEVLVYAIGIDGESRDVFAGRARGPTMPLPLPLPFPIPGRGQGRRGPPIGIPGGGSGGGVFSRGGQDDRVNVGALRNITDDTGGRTEIVKDFGDLSGATSRIADELSKQYYLGYASPGKKDGRWHSIRVEVRDRNLRVRARKGYVAS